MGKKVLRLLGMVLILLCLSVTSVRAEEDSGSKEEAEDIISQQMEALDFDSMDSIMGEVSQDTQFYEQNFAFQSFGDLLTQLVSGEVDLTLGQWVQEILNLLFKEIPLQGHLLLQVAALALLSQLLKSLDEHFQGSSAGEIGFFAVYGVLVMTLFHSFALAVDIVRSTTEKILQVGFALMPALAAVAAASGQVVSATIQSEVILGGMNLLLSALQYVVGGGIVLMVMLETANHISPKEMLGQFISLIRIVIEKGLKIVTSLFFILMGIQGIALPAMDKFLQKTASTAFSAVPVVGSALSGAVDTVLTGSTLVKNGIGAAGFLILLCICLLPMVKLIVCWLLYKVMAALLAPVADSRVIGLLSGMADAAGLLVAVLCSAIVIFMGAFGIFLYTTGASL